MIIPIQTEYRLVNLHVEPVDDGLLLAIVETGIGIDAGKRKACIAQLDKNQMEELKKVL